MSILQGVLAAVAVAVVLCGVVALAAFRRGRAARRSPGDSAGAARPASAGRPASPAAILGGSLLAGLLGSALGAAAIWLLVSSGRLPPSAAPRFQPPDDGSANPRYLVSTTGDSHDAAPLAGAAPSSASAAEASDRGGSADSGQDRKSAVENPRDRETLEHLRGQLAVVVQQRDEQASLRSQQAALLREYEQQLREATDDAQAARAELAGLQSQLETASGEAAEARRALDEQRRERRRSEQQLASAENRCRELERRLSAVTAARVPAGKPAASPADGGAPSPADAVSAAPDPSFDSSGWKAVTPQPAPVEYGRPVIELPITESPVDPVLPPILLPPGDSHILP